MTSSIQNYGHFVNWYFFHYFLKKPIEKETAVILKRIDQLPQNLARVHNLVGSFDKSHKSSIFSIVLLFSIVCLLSAFCSNFDTPLKVQDVH